MVQCIIFKNPTWQMAAMHHTYIIPEFWEHISAQNQGIFTKLKAWNVPNMFPLKIQFGGRRPYSAPRILHSGGHF